MKTFLKFIDKYNNGNIFLTGGMNSGKTSILYFLIENSLKKGEKIYLIDGEDELNMVYKDSKSLNINSIFISANLAKLKNFLSGLKKGDTIVIDGYKMLSKEVVLYIQELAKSRKYRIIIASAKPVKIKVYLFKYILALKTTNSYSRHIGCDTTKLQLGEVLVNGKEKIKFPYESLIEFKKHLVLNFSRK